MINQSTRSRAYDQFGQIHNTGKSMKSKQQIVLVGLRYSDPNKYQAESKIYSHPKRKIQKTIGHPCFFNP